jgi:hypothetical protein
MTIDTEQTGINKVLIMFTGVVAVELRSSGGMTEGAILIRVELSPTPPGRGGLPAVTAYG